jgi:DNA-binding CsgD family transcriptional regulator
MSRRAIATVLTVCTGVLVLVVLTNSRDGQTYLLAIPIWIVAKDLGWRLGLVAGVCALAFTLALGLAGELSIQSSAYPGFALLFAGTLAAGWGVRSRAADGPRRKGSLPLITLRPDVERKGDGLSRRELEVLEMVARGANNAQIASQFVISENTVKSHISRILHKLPAANRTEAAFRYHELYGAPPARGGEDEERVSAASAAPASVEALRGRDGVTLALQDGRHLELPLLQEMLPGLEPGTAAVVYFDGRDRPIGWYLPGVEAGVDLRRWSI